MPVLALNESPQIERFLEVRGWKKTHSFGHKEYDSFDPGSTGFRLYLWNDGSWTCREAIDGVIGQQLGKGSTLESLRDTLMAEDAIAWCCPYCGEEGGAPRTMRSRPYLYGADADGNRGEMREDVTEGCSKCITRTWVD